ncbi:F-box DNA helicase 1 [Oncorhynchus nerka]|uniref:F-box DNA helicase 1 n=1 Tax=Oncorhynchus nerka TaxID=8023 RepID=UPI001131F015|nr:F-box DNA helicase 1-like [Oncorhynchus nerka]XP_029521827.1 F-box DNA helicase 1-like [Oncorhynchus nerka]XP_029521828.1 F-box DNA helicase 1-like [Oncorhynchus nerka]XP_029521829.1 F-box DNA helicase 1-like [Oncorhynchus nerka]
MMESSTKGKAKRRHLNSEECREISRRPEGSQPLTQPHSVTRRHSNSDTNRGLYPRTPTKRKRDARDDKKQQGITKFFPVISVVKVLSPQKAALSQGSGSIKTEGLNGELIPKNETIEEKALATSMKEEPEDGKVDYLEGLTTDMFGDDKEFERCWSDPDPALMNHHEEEEVEALPDALYGLLGSSRGLAHPQGHVDDLPEEVLMLVLSLLPAEDLYCNVSLVCQRWRNIVTQSLFVPWKKLYYRYTKKEIDAVKEINAILETHRIIKDDQESILHIVEFMAQYKPSQKVKPESVLQSVRTHCLFPQAEACIKHRLPKLEGIEGGPNPWAAMALMLVLCDGVGDVLDLVVCLRSCLPSASAITEYLSAMATMLLAMRRNDINISNRWHYNIFYVLHLMENALPTAITNQSGRAQVQVTHEQQQILNHDIHRDHVVKIMAFAGTGKTTTLIRYAQQRPHHHFLYMAFNKSVATQAQRCFPSNVDCRTVHSMAFGAVGKRYQELKKLSSNVKPFSVAWVLPKGSGGFVNAKVVTLTLNAYMASADTHITPNHVPNTYKNTHGKMTVPDCNAKRMFARDAQRIWDKMVALEETREYAHHMTHDGYLKLWQLQRPTLDKYDVIFIDEAQDCTPAIMDIMLPQHCGKILVGDPHQQIYTFRGAVNALNLVEHTHLYYLTQSFRFGSEIAYIGATILQVCKKVKKILVGGKQDGCVWGKAVDSLRPLTTGLSPGRGKLAVLSRSNVSVFDQAVRLTDANPRCRLHIVGGVENFGLKRIMDIWVLMQPENNRSRGIKDSFIRRFTQQSLGGYFGLKSYAKKTEDRELEGKLSMVEKYNSRIPELVERLYGCTEREAQHADFILGTVHKSKGLEFDTVVITDDFAKVPCAAHNLPRLSSCSGGDVPDDEWNLLYVAVTRAKSSLVITKNITNILTLAGEYFLRTELTSTLLTEGQPPCCSVRECHNHIMPVWPLAMCKLPLQYMDSADDGGPMCGACVLQRVGPTASLLASPELLKVLPVTEERLNLPINYALLMALF